MSEVLGETEVARRVAEVADRLRGVVGEDDLGHVPDTVDKDLGHPFWRVEHGELVYRARDRGRVFSERRTTSVDTLLQWVFHDVTWSLARRWQLTHGVEGLDERRTRFPRWVALMAALDPAWGAATQAYVDEVLRRSPYGDD